MTVPATFFEKPKQIFQEGSLLKQMDVQGPISNYLKSKVTRLFDGREQDRQGYPLERDTDSKLTLALNAKKSEHLIVGFRLRIGGC